MKLNDNGNLINRYYQEKKQFRKELFKWSRQITEYCAFESFIEYLLPADKFRLFNKKYQDHCEKLKEEEMFECNEMSIEDELYLNNDSNKDLLKQQDFDENSYCDDDFYSCKENQLNDEPLDLSNKEKILNYDSFTQQYLLNQNENIFKNQALFDQQFDMKPYFNSSIDFLNLSKSICQAMALNDLNTKAQSLLSLTQGASLTTPNVTSASTNSTATSNVSSATTTTTTSNSTVTRRNYTKEELDRALADIQSGRIGTRRASVLYGIPRSTLRNKVFRLNNQKQSQRTQQQTINTTTSFKKQNQNDTKFNEIKDKLLNNLSINFAYEKLFSNNEKLNDDLIKYSKHSTINQASIQQYLNNTMFKILNDVVSEKLVGTANVPASNKLNENKSSTHKSDDISTKRLPPAIEATDHVKINHKSINTHLASAENKQFSLKQKRAKRGQYRKYESDQLNKAVDAVINGLMSVHKAGSHFGVPHSTLEYKVKERNMKSSSSSSALTSTTISTTTTTTTTSTSANLSTTSTKQPKTTTSINDKIKTLNKPNKLNENYLNEKNMLLFNNLASPQTSTPSIPVTQTSSAAGLPLLASNYFSASELLRKLYEGVHTTVTNKY